MALVSLGQCPRSLLASPPHWHMPPSSPPASPQAGHRALLFFLQSTTHPAPLRVAEGTTAQSRRQFQIPRLSSSVLGSCWLGPAPRECLRLEAPSLRLPCSRGSSLCVQSSQLSFPSLLGLSLSPPELPQEPPRFLLSSDYAEHISSLLVSASQAE